MALAHGEDVTVLSRRLGHADVGVTLRLYRHVMPGEDQAAADRLANLFGGNRDQTVTTANPHHL